LDATKYRINLIFCVVSHATVTPNTENHGSCKHPLRKECCTSSEFLQPVRRRSLPAELWMGHLCVYQNSEAIAKLWDSTLSPETVWSPLLINPSSTERSVYTKHKFWCPTTQNLVGQQESKGFFYLCRTTQNRSLDSELSVARHRISVSAKQTFSFKIWKGRLSGKKFDATFEYSILHPPRVCTVLYPPTLNLWAWPFSCNAFADIDASRV
jgi:hypothetical protein